MLRKKYIPALKQPKRKKRKERYFNQNKQKIKSLHLPTENPQANVLQGFLVHAEHRHNNQNTVLLTDTSVKRTPSVGPCLFLFPLFDSL